MTNNSHGLSPDEFDREVQFALLAHRLAEARKTKNPVLISDAFEALIGGTTIGGACQADEDQDAGNVHDAFADIVEDANDDENGEIAYECAVERFRQGKKEEAARELIKALQKDDAHRYTPLYQKLEDLVSRIWEEMKEKEADVLFEVIRKLTRKRLTQEQEKKAAQLFATVLEVRPDYRKSLVGQRLQHLLPSPQEETVTTQSATRPALVLLQGNKWKQLQELRKDFGLSQEAFAARLKVTKLTVLRWESGSHPPSKRHIGLLRLLVNLHELARQNPQVRQDLEQLLKQGLGQTLTEDRVLEVAARYGQGS